MTIETTSPAGPGPGEVWLEQEAVGVNFLDVTQRNGAVPIPLPSGLGLEGAGRVAAVGAGVANVREGDLVAYATGPLGAYASGRLYPAERLVHIPQRLTPLDAAARTVQGHYRAIPAEVHLSGRSRHDHCPLRRRWRSRPDHDPLGETPRGIRDRHRVEAG